MVFFNYASMEMSAKIVYYGPGLCGKTTNLKWIFDQMPKNRRGEMVSLATETDRTLFFDLLPLKLGKVGDFTTRIQLYTVPGQVFYNSTRKLVLKGVDGIVFVADSQEPMLDANIESLENLQENLAEQKLNLRKIPWVIQYNKRDLPGILSISVLNRHLNFMDVPSFESVATTGEGVMDSLIGISKLTLRHLRKKAGQEVSEDSDDLLLFEKELANAFVTKPALEIPAPPIPEPAVEVTASDDYDDKFDDAFDDEMEEEYEKKSAAESSTPPPAPVTSESPPEQHTPPRTPPVVKPSVAVDIKQPAPLLNGKEAEGMVIDRNITQKIRIPIKVSKEDEVSHINLNLKLEIECVLVSEISKKKTESKAEKLAARALEDFLLGKTKKRK